MRLLPCVSAGQLPGVNVWESVTGMQGNVGKRVALLSLSRKMKVKLLHEFKKWLLIRNWCCLNINNFLEYNLTNSFK